MVVVVSILTTPGATFFTIGAKLPLGSPSRGREVSSSGTFRAELDLVFSADLLVKADAAAPATDRAPASTTTGSLFRKYSNFVFITFSSSLDVAFGDQNLSGGLQICKNHPGVGGTQQAL